MDPSIPRRPAKDPALRREAERYVSTARDLLSGQLTEGKIERSRDLLIQALGLNPCASGGWALLVAADALRATHHRYRLPSGPPDPYCVFGLNPAAPTARDPAVIESYYRRASDLLNRSRPLHPCHRAFTHAARMVADAWAVLSDADRKASLDSRFEAPPPPPQPSAPPPPPQPSAPPTAQDDKCSVGRGKLSVPVTSPPAATTTTSDVVHGRRAGLRPRKRNNRLALTSPPAATTTTSDVVHGRRAGLRPRKRNNRLAG